MATGADAAAGGVAVPSFAMAATACPPSDVEAAAAEPPPDVAAVVASAVAGCDADLGSLPVASCGATLGSAPPQELCKDLAMFLGSWQSRRFGLLSLQPREHPEESDSWCEEGPDLLIRRQRCRADGGPPKELGRLFVCSDPRHVENWGRKVVAELPAPSSSSSSAPSHWLWLKPLSKWRVLWTSHDGSEVLDVWDRRLLEAIEKAAAWIDLQGLITHFRDHGYQALGQDELTASARSVALCITTKNRLWQLRRALPLNLLHCWPHRRWTTIHIVDFGSTDETLEWIMSRCRAAIDAGLLKVYYTDRQPFWHASIAKNTAHMVATEDIVVNLDGDNLIGPNFPVDVVNRFVQDGYSVLQYEDGDGTCGRIACSRGDFVRIRGYDEDAYPMGAQDVDLVHRLKELPNARFKKVRGSVHSQAIQNTQEAKVASCSPYYGRLKWSQMDAMNRSVFAQRRLKGHVVRNVTLENIGVKAWLIPGSDEPHS
eukprot:CAMPEP_0203924996 /NCGR_PEP_ID=MMETSP0359-20131031/64701_1 /ASSEMBLY_ACC=CAM_ASM_000338 /TAXON_ID=268821 /ORGANISM="Scrippsiella Hangoei, Strain SHTV-5" /LENGTH=484 /DNA_ID=CAMNT_0050853331 /DNA_START=89 /DNA_END=1543 /DNA_ORIENTATION=+